MNRVFFNIEEIFSPIDLGRPLRGKEMDSGEILKNGYIVVVDGKIESIGEGTPPEINAEYIDCSGEVALPGLIDAHTHLVYGGSRENEFARKLNGESYLSILESGGGILSTVKATREASFNELYEKTKEQLKIMLCHGVCSVEIKSGYGLNLEDEIKQLEVVKKLSEDLPMTLVPTLMAAHAIPPEFKDNREGYINEIFKIIEEVSKRGLAVYNDVFCEKGIFTAEESKRILEHGLKFGLLPRIHSDEIESIGGVEISNDLPIVSAEHLMVVGDDEIKTLSKNNVIGNLLPATTFSLMEDTYAPARKMLENDMAITLCTDSNPGSCPTGNLQFVMQLGALYMKLKPREIFNAVTINAAYSIGVASSKGSFTPGKDADITFMKAKNLEYLLYYFATNHCSKVYIKGEKVL